MEKSEYGSLMKMTRDKSCPYQEYYIGERDEEERKNGRGENHWSGAKSLECYTGDLLRDTMHGAGEYRWRHRGADVTYEGHFYVNQIHGYGTMSYPDGLVFTGIFYNNVRWGPGIEQNPNLEVNVGLWRGRQLVRLTWRPGNISVAPDFVTPELEGQDILDSYRLILVKTMNIVGEKNSALDLLKQCGAKDSEDLAKWPKVYSKICTDLNSKFCNVEVFDRSYYGDSYETLETLTNPPELEQLSIAEEMTESSKVTKQYFYAWNDSAMMVHMMNHCYKHEFQRSGMNLDLDKILCGPRKLFRIAGKHERDCRTLLMASFLGDIKQVVLLVNEAKVYPGVCDLQGNSAVTYATCGDNVDIINFLVEAGATVDSFNDSCCTPLGVALMRHACIKHEINKPRDMVLSILTHQEKKEWPSNMIITDWQIKRGFAKEPICTPTSSKSKVTIAKMSKIHGSKSHVNGGKSKSKMSRNSLYAKNTQSTLKYVHKTETPKLNEYDSEEEFGPDKFQYTTMKRMYQTKAMKVQSAPSEIKADVFGIKDMVAQLHNDIKEKYILSKSQVVGSNKMFSKEYFAASKEMLWSNKEESSQNSTNLNDETLSGITLTILQLLASGADPKLVTFPLPALWWAVIGGSSHIITHLALHGANVNDENPMVMHYTPLHLVVSRDLSADTADLVRALLEAGADPNRRLWMSQSDIAGPTLLHVLVVRKTTNDEADYYRRQIIDLLLSNGANPMMQYEESSALDYALDYKIDLMKSFVKGPKTNLNGIINGNHQTVLTKMFTLDYFRNMSGVKMCPVLTDLLLHGADPLAPCRVEGVKYRNLFEFATNVSQEMEQMKQKKSSEISAKNVEDYLLSLSLMRDCTRLTHIRWLQAKIMKQLIEAILKHKSRIWYLIFKSYDQKDSTALWLNAQRCLEIWDVLKTTKRRSCTATTLKILLCIVQFLSKIHYNQSNCLVIPIERERLPSSRDISQIESDVCCLLKEHKIAERLAKKHDISKKMYVKPELCSVNDKKFRVCCECALPLEDSSIQCISCKLVSFCALECMLTNMDRPSCHPCNEYLRRHYEFPAFIDLQFTNSSTSNTQHTKNLHQSNESKIK